MSAIVSGRGLASRTSQAMAVVALSVGFSLTSHSAETALLPPAISQDAIDALTALEGIPTVAQLQELIPGNTVEKLEEIIKFDPYAGGDNNDTAGGGSKERSLAIEWTPLRLRAIRALNQFSPPSAQTQLILHNVLVTNATFASGHQLLLTQAALEALGPITDDLDVETVDAVTDALAHSSRDVRVAAARALSQIAPRSALDALLQANQLEQVPAVRLAIAEALRALGETPAPPVP